MPYKRRPNWRFELCAFFLILSLISSKHNLCAFTNIFTYLQGEKASAEREIKRLHGQNSLLERDMNKRDSLAGRRRDSVMSDSKRTKNLAFEQTLQVVTMFYKFFSVTLLHKIYYAACKLF